MHWRIASTNNLLLYDRDA